MAIHSGASADYGHYYSFARASNDIHGQWFSFNDSFVNAITLEHVHDTLKRFPKDVPYIVSYCKRYEEHHSSATIHPVFTKMVQEDDKKFSYEIDTAIRQRQQQQLNQQRQQQQQNIVLNRFQRNNEDKEFDGSGGSAGSWIF